MARKSYWQGFQARRISRRRLIGTAGAGAAGLAVAAACGGGEKGPAAVGSPGATGQPAGQPKYGGRMKGGSNAVFDTIDPHVSIAALTTFPRIYNVLVKQSELDAEFLFLDLAEEFEMPEPGSTEWIFHIRPGVKIAPNDLGVPVRDMDAEDAQVTYERVGSEETAIDTAFVSQNFASHEATDPQTYVIRTNKPYAWFFPQISGFNYTITIPPKELILNDPQRLKTTGVGGGPFFVRKDGYSEGEFLILDKNPNYYRKDEDNNNAQLPYVEGRDSTTLPDPAAIRVAFLDKQIYSFGANNRAEVDSLLSQHDDMWASEPVPTLNFMGFSMNATRKPWDDPKVRKAAMHAINRQEYIDVIYGGEADPAGIVHKPIAPYALPEEELEGPEGLQRYDPELSKQLIKDAGYDLPLKIKVIFPTGDFLEGDQHLAIWTEQMEAAGFELDITLMDLGTWITQYTNVDYDSSLHPHQGYPTPEFPLQFHHSLGPRLSGIYSKGIQDPEVDAALDASKEITDPEELVKAVHDVQRLIYEKGPAELNFVTPFTRTVYWNFVKNPAQGLGTGGTMLNTVWLDL